MRWRLPFAGWGEPAADASGAYFLTRAHDVVAADAATGSIRWRSGTGGDGEVPTGTQVRLTPARVLVGDGGIVALDRASGRRLWRFEAPDGDDPGVFLGAADGDLVVAGSPMGRVYAVDAASGTLRWTRGVAAGARRVVFAPIRVGGLVVASFTTFDGPLSGGVVAFTRGGVPQWTYRFVRGAGAAGPPVAVGGVVVTARTDGRIEAVRLSSGHRAWALPPEGPGTGDAARDIRALASRGDRLVVSSLHGPIRAYDAATRRQRWHYAGGPMDAVPLRLRVYGGYLYVPYSDGSLVALDLSTGAERWRTAADNRTYDWPPAAVSTALYAAGSQALCAFDPPRPASMPRRDRADHDR